MGIAEIGDGVWYVSHNVSHHAPNICFNKGINGIGLIRRKDCFLG